MKPERKIRQSKSRGTSSYQLGHYEMQGDTGKRRSIFKVDVHLGEYPTVEDALTAWPGEIDHLRKIGRDSKANKLQKNLDRLRQLSTGEDS